MLRGKKSQLTEEEYEFSDSHFKGLRQQCRIRHPPQTAAQYDQPIARKSTLNPNSYEIRISYVKSQANLMLIFERSDDCIGL